MVAPDLKLGTHFLRASRVTSAEIVQLFLKGVLKRHGRWKTDIANDGYMKDCIENRLSVTKVLNL